jgi:hypothetical protein
MQAVCDLLCHWLSKIGHHPPHLIHYIFTFTLVSPSALACFYAGASLMATCLLPSRSVSLTTAPGGWVALFAAGLLLPRLQRKPLEVCCLAPFVFASAAER